MTLPRFSSVLGLAATTLLIAQGASERIGEIEFFGYGRLDPAALRAALPLKEGEPRPQDMAALRESVRKATGRTPSDLAGVCCDARGQSILYIGLGGDPAPAFSPKGDARLPKEAKALSEAATAALIDAVKGGNATEDDSQGFALGNDPALRRRQLEIRAFAVAHEPQIRQTLLGSADVDQRRIAAEFLGYVRRSDAQIGALVRAARDPDDEVRNNATRALGVIVASGPAWARRIPADPFIAMLRSQKWTDRNKAALLLVGMTSSRDPRRLASLRKKALPDLIEMARWRTVHASTARFLLGRIAGIPDSRIQSMNLEEIVRAARESGGGTTRPKTGSPSGG